MAPPISTAGLDLTTGWEGWVPTWYRDIAGVWTRGFGHARRGGEPIDGPPLTLPQGRALLAEDMARCSAPLDAPGLGLELTQGQADALRDWLFNCGPGALGTKAAPSGVLRALLQGRPFDVPAELCKWCMVTINGVKQVNKGLLNRRRSEGHMWTMGVEPLASGPEGRNGEVRGLEIAVPDEEIAARGAVLLWGLAGDELDEERRADLEQRNRDAGF